MPTLGILHTFFLCLMLRLSKHHAQEKSDAHCWYICIAM